MINQILNFQQLDDVIKLLNNTHLEVNLGDLRVDILWLGYHVAAPGQSSIVYRAGVHKHSFFELHFCLNGSCEYQVKDRRYTIMPGEMIFLRAKEIHSLISKTEDFSKVALGFDIISRDDNLSTTIYELLSRRPSFIENKTDKIADLFYCILEECAARKTGYIEAIQAELLLIILQCARMAENGSEHQPTFVQRIDRRVAEINAYIEEHMQERITCTEIAKNIHLSTRQLNRVVQNEFGMPVSAYIDRLKCEHAKNLLLHSDMPISLIAISTGFASEFSFSKFFKRVEGMAPSQFRRSRFGGYTKSVMDDK